MNNHLTKGFTLFYALLVASLALAIGASIFDLTVREIQLSGAATQSQYAVYVSDSGAECALYWDSRYTNAVTNDNGGTQSIFATSSLDTLEPPATSGIYCAGADITAVASSWAVTADNSNATSTFTLMGTAYKNVTPCAVVSVVKNGNPSVTTVTSHGYNTCVAGPLQLERVFQVSY